MIISSEKMRENASPNSSSISYAIQPSEYVLNKEIVNLIKLYALSINKIIAPVFTFDEFKLLSSSINVSENLLDIKICVPILIAANITEKTTCRNKSFFLVHLQGQALLRNPSCLPTQRRCLSVPVFATFC